MAYLLDTHTFLWFAKDVGNLSAKIRDTIEDPTNDIRISVVSFWEITIKSSIGKLALATSILGLGQLAQAENISILPLTLPAIEQVAHMPQHHKDPFDRIIAATAMTSGDVLLSADAVFDSYGVTRTWA